ncbi:MAG: TIR domain-containing protein, partial [Candidatus Angelobacter sp.]
MNHRFFFSYAHMDANADPDAGWIQRFRKDLGNAVNHILGNDQGLGFYDGADIQLGEVWPDVLMSGLNNCRAVVCLHSPSYFHSDFCGREVEVFRRRLNLFREMGGRSLRLIIPVLWQEPKWMDAPNSIAEFQYTIGDFPKIYCDRGLRFLMSQLSDPRSEAAYNDFITLLAGELVNATGGQGEPDENVKLLNQCSLKDDIRYLSSAWTTTREEPREASRGGRQVSAPTNQFLKMVKFVFVVGKPEQLQEIGRIHLDSYDDDARFWRPFQPKATEEAALLAQQVANEGNLRVESIAIGGTREDLEIIR